MTLLKTFVLLVFWVVALPSALGSEAYTPKSDREVVEKLPENLWKRSTAKVPERPRTPAPATLQGAIGMARRNIEVGKAEGDPRFLSRTEALLAKWCDGPEPSPEALVLRAYARQSLHAFDQALVDLNRALALDSGASQAWLLKSSILQVKGNYGGARAASFQLLRLGRSFEGMVCAASIASLTGNAKNASETLRAATALGQTGEQKQWALVTLAETEARLGNSADAESHFRQALEIPRRDTYLKGAFADFLLDQNRPAEVIAFLRDETLIDGFLLRLAVAEKKAGAREFKVHAAELRSRFGALRARRDKGHLREEARFELEVLENPSAALPLALENWTVQHEPVDAWLVIASAVLNHGAALPVADWIKETKLENVKIKGLIENRPLLHANYDKTP